MAKRPTVVKSLAMVQRFYHCQATKQLLDLPGAKKGTEVVGVCQGYGVGKWGMEWECGGFQGKKGVNLSSVTWARILP